jgi:outer membrane autotransporter protein
VYGTEVAGFDRSRWLIGLGTNFVFDSDFSIRVEYRGVFGSSGDRDNALQLIFQKSY